MDRLQKILSQAGIASRRASEQLMLDGRVTVNGESRELPGAVTVAELVTELGLNQRRIAVEVNCDIVPREHYAAQRLQDGDTVIVVNPNYHAEIASQISAMGITARLLSVNGVEYQDLPT